MPFLNILENLKEFLNLDAQKRALIISYILLGGIIYFQYTIIQDYKEEKINNSKNLFEIQLDNEKHCQQLLLAARNRYQENLERDRDFYQHSVDSLINEIVMLKRRYRNDNNKVIRKINEND